MNKSRFRLSCYTLFQGMIPAGTDEEDQWRTYGPEREVQRENGEEFKVEDCT